MNIQTLQHSGFAGSPMPRTLVTGATSGIGWELASQMALAGVAVVALGRNALRLQELQDRCPTIDTVVCDLQDTAALLQVVAQIVARHPDLACVINNAGMQEPVRMDDAGYGAREICREIDVNLVAPVLLAHALLPHFQTRAAACVVNITSGLGYVPKRNGAVYSATKAGLHLFTQALRVQLQGSAVRVVEAVLPLVDTPMTAGRGSGKLSAEHAARQIFAGLQAGQSDIWVGKARALPLLQRWAPGLLAKAMQGN
jgi:short-subunit dehydrogenase involved in D-alanine esterification of teichoic acids